jgi:hypothetical protein
MAMLDGPKQIAEMKNFRHLVDPIDGLKPELIHMDLDAESCFGVKHEFRSHEFRLIGTKNQDVCASRFAYLRANSICAPRAVLRPMNDRGGGTTTTPGNTQASGKAAVLTPAHVE